MAPRDVVLLVPGFFGFSRFSNFYYFADRVSAALRGALEYWRDAVVPVLAVATQPTGGLAARQVKLLSEIQRIDNCLGTKAHIHLVAHSSGGLDAYLLTCSRPLSGDIWCAQDQELRSRIRSITTVAAPFGGTCLSAGALSRFALDPAHNLASVPSALKLAEDVLGLHARDPLVLERIASLAAVAPEAGRFCMNLLQHRELVSDLSPGGIAQLMKDRPRDKEKVRIRNFVTAVPRNLLRHAAPFFQDLWTLTATLPSGAADVAAVHRAAQRALPLLNAQSSLAIRPADASPPIFDESTNDGVVNSALQLAEPNDASTLAGIIVADHADVLGHYDGIDGLIGGPPLNESVFRSGAGFCDNQFYELYRRVAECVLAAVAPPYRSQMQLGPE